MLRPGKGKPDLTIVVFTAIVALAAAVALAGSSDTSQPTGNSTVKSPDTYGLWVLLPALSAIGLAVITRRVMPALAVGVLVASYMLVPCLTPEQRYGTANTVVGTVRVALQTFVWDSALLGRSGAAEIDTSHLQILLFTSLIAAMVGIIGAGGGTRALVDVIARRASSRRGGQAIAWAAGLVVFFDDYANTMIVGPTMQPIFDRLKLSRAKLAYIVDSTAAPVASIALVGTWLGAEIGFIQVGMEGLAQGDSVPGFLAGVTAWQAFLYSIPHRYYAIFAIVMVLLIAVSGRDFGPMRKAERQASQQAEPGRVDISEPETGNRGSRWWQAGIPILALITVTLGTLFGTGWVGVESGQPRSFVNVLSNADAYGSILYGATASVSLALVLSLSAGAISLVGVVRAMVRGVRRVVPALVILVLAWALSSASQALHLGEIATRYLMEANFEAAWLPLCVFLSAAVVSFATGTSWGTMGILCPVVVTVAARLAADLPADRALDLFYASVGGVLAGAIFGDHCSPISDTTVLSAIASGCTLESHVWTQLPYAVTVALAGVVFGDLLSAHFGVHWSIGLVLGIVALFVVVRVVGQVGRVPPAERNGEWRMEN